MPAISPNKLNVSDGLYVYTRGKKIPFHLPKINRIINAENHVSQNHPFYNLDAADILEQYGQPGDNFLTFMYRLYDELVALNTRIGSRKVIGTDSQGNELVEYTFGQKVIGKQGSFDTESNNMPRVLCSSGVHGQERNSIITLYLTIRDIIVNWETDEWANTMINSVMLVVLPCANTSGVVRNNRRNINNVDINRNFPTDWQIGDSTTKGSAPASELETQNYIAWVKSYEGRNMGLLECHDHGDRSIIYGITHHPMSHQILFNSLRDLYNWTYPDHTNPNNPAPGNTVKGTVLSWIGRSIAGGSTRHASVALRQPAILIEHGFWDHPQGGPGIHRPRMIFRFLTRRIISRMLQQYESKGYWDNFFAENE